MQRWHVYCVIALLEQIWTADAQAFDRKESEVKDVQQGSEKGLKKKDYSAKTHASASTTNNGVACTDTDNGATDPYGDDCTDYAIYPTWCGGYDSYQFTSTEMCCACGGGSYGFTTTTGGQAAACTWQPVSSCPCTTSDGSGCDLPECTISMANGALCEADGTLPDGTQNFNIDNCPGSYDVFVKVCTYEAVNTTTTTIQFRNSCLEATDLSTLSSPFQGTTTDGTNSHDASCGGNGNEKIFYIDVPSTYSFSISMSSNNYDSRHETRWGGACPGTNAVQCTDDPDTLQHKWYNDQGTTQRAYFLIDAYSSGSGDFTLQWSLVEVPPLPSINITDCGRKGVDDSTWTRIVNGQDATECEYTWQVSMRSRWGSHYCGGSIISPDWVLTAAHCVDGAEQDKIVVGDHKRTANSDTYQEEYEIEQIIPHPQYNSNSLDYDFALIRLRTPITFNFCVGPICLPESDPSPGAHCMVSGWGTLSSGGSLPEILQEGGVSLLSNSVCMNDYSYSAGEILPSMVCATAEHPSGGHVDSCQGDSGGPLACQDDATGSWVLQGVVSWGYGCADSRYPGVYSRVWSVLQWIQSGSQTPGAPAPATTTLPPPIAATCTWQPVSSCPCTDADTSGCDLQECTNYMANGALCEADAPLPDGTQNYNIDNCPGTYDVFFVVCDDQATINASTTQVVDSCLDATDLSTLTSPLQGTTVDGANTHHASCGGNGKEKIYYIDVPSTYSVSIAMSTNNYDSRHETRWGGPCPGTHLVLCTDDPDDRLHKWYNDQGTTQRVYFLIDAYSSGSGDFTLQWSLVEVPPLPLFNSTDCGQKGADDSPWMRSVIGEKIVNGQDATECEYTWQVSMRSRWGGHYCGGSILSPDWILTAAHCVDGAEQDLIIVGDHKRTTNSDTFQEEYEIEEIIPHSLYNSNSLVYDFALIRLRTPITFNSCVGPICLPAYDASPGAHCMVSGWGTLQSGGSLPDTLQEGGVNLISNSACVNDYSYSASDITPSMVCATAEHPVNGGTVDSCQGDSGGPLACQDDATGNWMLQGVVSWGYGCAVSSYPGVYARVWSVLEWIQIHIGLGTLPPPQPTTTLALTTTPAPIPASPEPEPQPEVPTLESIMNATDCGQKGADNSPWTRIVNGQDATECEYTWQVSMRSSWGSHYCGGSIISPDWILTAAHCVGGAEQDKIVVGDYKRTSNSDAFQAEYEIEQIIPHVQYNSGTIDYDFALIRLRTPITFNSCVGPVCLPDYDAPPGTECMVSGWGTLQSGGSLPNTLQEGGVNLISNAVCINNYGYSASDITSSMVCATAEHPEGLGTVDSCQGDSGGPLACKDDATGNWMLQGVVSWGYGCANSQYPGVYARVWSVLDWVHQQMSATWTPPIPAVDSCVGATNLSTLTSPFQGTTVDGANSHGASCGGNGKEKIFYIDVPSSYQLSIGMSTNNYDSRHETRWGGACPGANEVACTDDPDNRYHNWFNDQTATQRVYFLVDAYSAGSGTFTLEWSVVQAVNSCAGATSLSTLSSPFQGTTVDGANSHGASCGGNGNEKIFFIDVPSNYSLSIGMSTNNYDSRHETRWGGACPGTNFVECTDDPDNHEHTWLNDQGTTQRVYFLVDAYNSANGEFTLEWTLGQAVNSCVGATDLSTLSSPFEGSTADGSNTHDASCGGYGKEKIFYIDVPSNHSLTIGMSTNNYDSRHETRWGGACPGTHPVACTDDPDNLEHTWLNDQGTTQRVYFLVDAYSSGSGEFTLKWSLTQAVNSCAGATNLSTLSSPFQGTTLDGGNSHDASCGGNGQEKIFFIDVPSNYSLSIGMSTNNYDSRHETRWGGPCPGTNAVACTDDPDDRQHGWFNNQGTTQRVYFLVDAYSSGSGNFTLQWSLVEVPTVIYNASGCGRKGTDDTSWSRIVNGQAAAECEYTWQVSMRMYGDHRCGGSIISDSWILTAAHCVEFENLNLQDLTIVVGEYMRSSSSEANEQEYEIEQIMMHSQYDPMTVEYDFALVRLRTPIAFNSCVGPVCLPTAEAVQGAQCMVSGWGAQKTNGGMSDALQEGGVTLINNSACVKDYDYTASEIYDSMICATATHPNGSGVVVDACQGDSGGPLACQDGLTGNWVLQGVVSWGRACASPHYPGVYSRVSKVFDWVQLTMLRAPPVQVALTASITSVSTTQASTTSASTTQASTTSASTTQASTTSASTTQASTTNAPTTQAPTTKAPTSEAPTTQASTTPAPTTEAPTAEALTTQASTTPAPTTEASTIEASTTEAPTTLAPTTETPTTEAPTTQALTTPAPTTEAPTTQAPTLTTTTQVTTATTHPTTTTKPVLEAEVEPEPEAETTTATSVTTAEATSIEDTTTVTTIVETTVTEVLETVSTTVTTIMETAIVAGNMQMTMPDEQIDAAIQDPVFKDSVEESIATRGNTLKQYVSCTLSKIQRRLTGRHARRLVSTLHVEYTITLPTSDFTVEQQQAVHTTLASTSSEAMTATLTATLNAKAANSSNNQATTYTVSVTTISQPTIVLPPTTTSARKFEYELGGTTTTADARTIPHTVLLLQFLAFAGLLVRGS